jgi:2-polyprenyl-6-methoxyphenol hydroxylase-like FAD-dependent oxidoreductase
MREAHHKPEVVIVGAGPCGLAAAIELGTRNISCLVLERQTRSGRAPRAKTTHTRTREHLRRWGIADKLAAASPFGIDYPANVLFVTSLSGQLIHRFENALNCSPERDERYSEHSQWIPQYKLESVLLEHASSLESVRIEFGNEFLSLGQDAQSVRIRTRDGESGSEGEVESRFVIGADGAGSAVRQAIGAKMIGTYGLSYNYNIIFRAPGLAEAHQHGPGIMYWQLNAEAPSLIGPMDEPDIWFFMPTGLTEGKRFTDEESRDLIRRSTGIDIPYEILSSDEWVASRLLADRYNDGNVYLIGDACHLHPPFGGFGMNMGIADGVDIGWKIAAVIQGWGGSELLESYELERRPAHEYVMDEAEMNHSYIPSKLVREGMQDQTPEGAKARDEVACIVSEHKRNEFYALGVVLGYCYQQSPVIVDDGTVSSWVKSRDYVPSAIPGCLAPHKWMDDGRSLYDLFGNEFTLLVLGQGHDEDVASALEEAASTDTPLNVVSVFDPTLAALYESELALIRPDQYVAWRGNEWPNGGLFSIVTGRNG